MALAEKVRALTGSRSTIVTIPYDQAYEAGFEDMPRRVPDLRKIQALVGYAPKAESRRHPQRRHRPLARPPMSVLATLRRKARSGAEAALRGNAKHVRRLLLATGRDEAPLPEIVQIESTNICNAKCVFCPRDDMERRQGIMDMALFRKIVDECVELGIEHVRMHNYGEPFVDRALVEKVRYAKQKGMPQVGMISNGSLITEAAARGMIDAGLDAINISVDASGKETFEKTRLGLKYDKVIANVERLLALRDAAGTARPKLILSFVRQNNSDDEQRVHRALAQARRQDPHHRPAQLGGDAEPALGRELPLLPALADVHGALGRPGVALLRRLRRPDDPRRPAHVHDQGDLELGGLPGRPPGAPRVRRPGYLPVVRFAEERLAALGHEALLTGTGVGINFSFCHLKWVAKTEIHPDPNSPGLCVYWG